MLLFTLLFLIGVQKSTEEREHKIHNIVLHPEKYSWCITTPIQQIVGSPGYKPVTIDNNVCVGVCYSYSIPKTQPAEPGELIGPYCDSCQPAKIKCYHVNLQATEKNIEGPRTIQKRVQIIVDCACATCDKIRKDDCDISDENTMELPSDLFYQSSVPNKTEEEQPELLKMQKLVYDHLKNGHHFKHHHHKKLFGLFQGGDDDNDNGTVNKQLNEIFDYQKMKDILEKNADNDEDNGEDSFIIPISQDVLNKNHYNIETTERDVETTTSTTTVSGHSHHHKHHLGEVQEVEGTEEHLVKGPHGSMVLEPDALKRNDEGVVISYENPPSTK